MTSECIMLDAERTKNCLPYDRLIPAMYSAIRYNGEQGGNSFLYPPRYAVNFGSANQSGGNKIGFMSGIQPSSQVLCHKFVCLDGRGLQDKSRSHDGLVILFDFAKNVCLGLVDAGELTARRTAAMSIVATEIAICLRQKQAQDLTIGICGGGRQALEHARAFSEVYPLANILVYARDLVSAQKYFNLESSNRIDFLSCGKELAEISDILCLCTSAEQPYLELKDTKPGCHINAIGACQSHQAEIHIDSIGGFLAYTDDLTGAQKNSGEFKDIVLGKSEQKSNLLRPIFEILVSTERTGEKQCLGPNMKTIYKGLGHGVQDFFAAHLALELAESS